MIRAFSARQVRDAEKPHLDAGEPLMRRAAAGLAAVIRDLLPQGESLVLVLVGSGNNGGDALYAGAELATGAGVVIVPTADRMHEDGLDAARSAGATVADAGEISSLAARAAVIVDGILGTGTSANPALRGAAREIVAAVLAAESDAVVVAVDIPSGIDPDDGRVPDAVMLPADITVTFGGYKAGLLLPPASSMVGRVVLIDIGLGPDLDRLEPVLVVADA